jgi:heat-inducible transcriptional repressor
MATMKPATTNRQNNLAQRAAEILHSIVHAYIDSGEPIASRTISRQSSAALSPATIRNIMADLSDDGFLSQPHTSAGRVPTAKAFREYVHSLHVSKNVSVEATRLRNEIRNLNTMEERVELSSHLLTQISHSMGIAAAIPTDNQILDCVELIGLADRRVLMVVVTKDRTVRDKVVSVERDLNQDELITLRNYINANFSGWTFSAIQREMQARLEQERASYDLMLQRLSFLMQKGLLDIGLAPTLHTEGASNLVGVELHLTREKLREIFKALEEKQRILELLERFLEENGEVAVQVGLGDLHPAMDGLSLIGLTVPLPGGVAAKVAVLGPMRMNYERVMSAVYHIGQALQA